MSIFVTYVLVISMWRGGGVTITYPTEAACEAARAVYVAKSAIKGDAVCIPGAPR